ncbi:hypothetical protein Tco_0483728 [Tanacetum coccineum]
MNWSLMISTTTLKCNEHGIEGGFNFNTQNIACSVPQSQGHTLNKVLLVPIINISKEYTQANLKHRKSRFANISENRANGRQSDETPVSLALMATNSEMEYDLKMRDLKLEEKQKELDQALRERDDFKKFQKKTVFNSENSETSFENKSPNSQNSVGQESRTKGLGNKGGKLCFVCYSPNHLIKNCNLHERTFKQTQTHKPKGTQGSRDTRPVWNNINRVNHSNFSGNSRYPHQKRSFTPSAVLTREGLKSTARPKMTRTVPSKSTANVFYQGTARPRLPHAVLSQSTGRPYYPRMDNTRPRTSSFLRTPHRPQRPKKIVKSIWVKKGSTVGSQAVLPQKVRVKGGVMINPKQTWRPKGNYLDSVNRDNGSYTLKQFEYGNPEEDLKDYAIIDSGYVAFGNDPKGGRITGKGTIKTSCIDFEKVSYVEELKFNLLSVSQICDKKHNVLFTDKECLILSPKFKFVDEEGEDVDVHLYRSMIGCLMYLTASRPDIMFAVCLCARFQVTPKVSHLHAVKRIFRYLKHQPNLGLWYPKDSPFHLEAFSDSDYAGDNHDRRSTSGGCQYLGRRLVSWQCKKQTIVAISSTEAEYVAAASCCAQVLWMQNQLLDYGFNFMNTEIHIDNESTICIVKNPVFHSKTKHIQIRHHFIRDCYEQRLINVVKVHTDDNVADLLTKGFDKKDLWKLYCYI